MFKNSRKNLVLPVYCGLSDGQNDPFAPSCTATCTILFDPNQFETRYLGLSEKLISFRLTSSLKSDLPFRVDALVGSLLLSALTVFNSDLEAV